MIRFRGWTRSRGAIRSQRDGRCVAVACATRLSSLSGAVSAVSLRAAVRGGRGHGVDAILQPFADLELRRVTFDLMHPQVSLQPGVLYGQVASGLRVGAVEVLVPCP